MKNLVDVKWLLENKDKVILVDATSNFLDATEGKAKYEQKHIPNTFHMDLDDDLRGSLGDHGGRHPLPDDMNEFAKKLEDIGISDNSNVVVYDEGVMYAARFWWMCKHIGLKNVKVLDGGIMEWIKTGNETTNKPTPLPKEKGKINVHLNRDSLVEYADIRRILREDTKRVAIVDSRPNERYKGLNETVDTKAGHIPTALNYFFKDVLDDDGKYKDIEFLKDHYKDLLGYDELIIHCGSGVSGAVNILALDEIGVSSKFYVGSWSDYITHEDAVIVRED